LFARIAYNINSSGVLTHAKIAEQFLVIAANNVAAQGNLRRTDPAR
jgi:hypothetical protein